MNIVQKRAVSFVLAFMVIISSVFSSSNIQSAAAASKDSSAMDSHRELSAMTSAEGDSSGLGAAQGYNLVCFGGFENTNSDVGGKSAIGGAIKISGFGFGNGLNADIKYGLVWGATDGNGSALANGGSVAKALIYEGLRDFEHSTFTFNKGCATWKDSGELKKEAGFTFDELRKQLAGTSKAIADLAAGLTPPTQKDGADLIFKGTDPDTNVFTVSAETLEQYNAILLNTPADSTDIINVTGTDVTLPRVDYSKSGSNLTGNGNSKKVEHLLWNLSEAKTVTNVNSIEGSVLAPSASFTPKAGTGNYEGTLIVASFTCGGCGFEGHNYPFNGTIPGDNHENSDLKLDKTAKVIPNIGWDDRQYEINLSVTAKSKIVTSNVPCDVVLVLDCSGSMDDEYYCPIQGTPGTGKTYFICRGTDRYGKPVYTALSHDAGGWYYTTGYGHKTKNYVEFKVGGTGTTSDEYTAVEPGDISTSNFYYVEADDTYQKVRYYPYGPQWGYPSGWYYGGFFLGWYRADPKDTTFYTVAQHTYYQFYIDWGKNKLAALKEAAKNFVTSVQKNSTDNRIGVVSFSSSSKETDLIALNNANVQKIDKTIDGLTADGGTHSYKGMYDARSVFYNADEDKTVGPDGRNRAVVMFTDGEPGDHGFSTDFGYEAAASTINESAVLKAGRGKSTESDVSFEGHQGVTFREDHSYSGTPARGNGCGASVYTIGLFSGGEISDLTSINDYMTAVASGADKYFTVSNTSSLDDIFQEISKEVGSVSGAAVTDVLDPRFELTPKTASDLEKDGATVTVNLISGATTVKWPNQTINVPEDGTPSWTKKFEVQAKADYIGGNAVPTNASGSGVSYGNNQYVAFPQPLVNVKAKLAAHDAMATIFRGEEVPGYKAAGCKGWKDSNVDFQWYQSDEKTILADRNKDFPSGQTPDANISYVLKAFYNCGTPTEESTDNSGGHTAGDKNSNYNLTAKGTYTVTVVTGELDITKNMDYQYPVNDRSGEPAIDPQQSFVFQITRKNQLTDPTAEETFYEVITPDAGMGIKKITGLKKGYYTVTELGGSGSWRYTPDSTKTTNNDTSGTISSNGTVCTAFIGRNTAAAEETPSYFGSLQNPAKVSFTNNLSNHQWFGDTTVVVNTISNRCS